MRWNGTKKQLRAIIQTRYRRRETKKKYSSVFFFSYGLSLVELETMEVSASIGWLVVDPPLLSGLRRHSIRIPSPWLGRHQLGIKMFRDQAVRRRSSRFPRGCFKYSIVSLFLPLPPCSPQLNLPQISSFPSRHWSNNNQREAEKLSNEKLQSLGRKIYFWCPIKQIETKSRGMWALIIAKTRTTEETTRKMRLICKERKKKTTGRGNWKQTER